MTTTELYEQIGADYDEAKARLQMDKLIDRFIVRFLDDTSCAGVVEAWAAGDEKAAFEAAHSAKGVCANLALTRLAALSSDICEALRPGNDDLRATTDVDALVAELAEAHAQTVTAISAYTTQK